MNAEDIQLARLAEGLAAFWREDPEFTDQDRTNIREILASNIKAIRTSALEEAVITVCEACRSGVPYLDGGIGHVVTTPNTVLKDTCFAAALLALLGRVPLPSKDAPVCSTCNDTHRMSLNGNLVPCVKCPTPCQECRIGGTGPFCATTPCSCDCHWRAKAVMSRTDLKPKIDTSSVRGLRVLVACTNCREKGRVPGGKYQSQGEVINCPICDGNRVVPKTVTLEEFREILRKA